MTTTIPLMTTDERLDLSCWIGFPWPDNVLKSDTTAFVATAHAAGALRRWKAETGKIRLEPRLSMEGKAGEIRAIAEKVFAQLATAETQLALAEGEAFALRKSFLDKVAPQNAAEIARFTVLWQHARNLDDAVLRRLPFVEAGAAFDIEALRALHNAPKLLNLTPLPEVRQRLEEVIGEALDPAGYAKWQQLTRDIAIARRAIAAARSYLRTDADETDLQREQRNATEKHRRLLMQTNRQVL